MTKLGSLSLLIISLVTTQAGLTWATPFDDLLTRVPSNANTLVLIDVTATLATPAAEEAGWGKQLGLDNVERPIFLPPEATKLVVAASLRADHHFSRVWEMAVMQLSQPLSMLSIARSEGGYLDEIRGVEAAWTPSDAYFVSLGDHELGVMYPAERQFVSHWVDFTQKNSDNQISDYLRSAIKLENEKVPIVMAFDLQDVVRPHELDEKLQESAHIKKAGLSTAKVATILTSLQGAVLRVAVGKRVQGQLRIDFTEPVAPIETIAKELVIEALNDLGLPTDDLADWKLELEEKAITLRGALSKDIQRRVFSIVEIPSTKFSTHKDAVPAVPEQPSESKIRESSQTYYASTEVLIKDLRRTLRGNVASSAVMERYARKIDRMPILHVDGALIDYGSKLAETLRSMALSKRQGGIQAGVGTAGMGYSSYNVGYNANTVDVRNGAVYSASERSSINAHAMANSKNMRVQGFESIDDNSAAIRRQMTEKYDVEF